MRRPCPSLGTLVKSRDTVRARRPCPSEEPLSGCGAPVRARSPLSELAVRLRRPLSGCEAPVRASCPVEAPSVRVWSPGRCMVVMETAVKLRWRSWLPWPAGRRAGSGPAPVWAESTSRIRPVPLYVLRRYGYTYIHVLHCMGGRYTYTSGAELQVPVAGVVPTCHGVRGTGSLLRMRQTRLSLAYHQSLDMTLYRVSHSRSQNRSCRNDVVAGFGLVLMISLSEIRSRQGHRWGGEGDIGGQRGT